MMQFLTKAGIALVLGVGTLAVVFALGPLVDVTSRLMRLDVHQSR